MTRKRLEALSFDSLKAVAAREGIDVPDGVEKILLIDLLLEIAEDRKEEQESRNNNPVRVQQKKYDVSLSRDYDLLPNPDDGILPEGYNTNRIVMLLRDPSWAYVYWDVKGGTLQAAAEEIGAQGALLRVLRFANEGGDVAPGKPADSYDIPLGPEDTGWYVNIPDQDSFYRVELALQGENSEKILVRSNLVRVPRAVTKEDLSFRDGTPLNMILTLSGVENLDVFTPKRSIPQRINSLHEDSFL